uniref:(northern house mosquito) hypothetical protein n=1 Tax=Culex pipiens TaxID=7175 RepID=A0A8D8K2T6_CULPI
MTNRTAKSSPSSCWTRRAPSTARARCGTARPCSRSARCSRPCRSTTCPRTSRRTTCSIFSSSPSTGGWRWPTAARSRSSGCSFWCATGAFRTRPSTVRWAARCC